jgi:hypothetical protein
MRGTLLRLVRRDASDETKRRQGIEPPVQKKIGGGGDVWVHGSSSYTRDVVGNCRDRDARASPNSLGRGHCSPRRRAARRRGRDLGDARGQHRAHVPGHARSRRQAQSDRLLARPARLEEPDADAQSRRDLLHGVLRYEGRTGRARDSAGRRRRHQRQHHGSVAGRAGGRRSGRRRQGRGRQISDHAGRPAGHRPGRLHRSALGQPPRLRAAALDPQERQRRRRQGGRRLRQAYQALSAQPGGGPARDRVRRRER